MTTQSQKAKHLDISLTTYRTLLDKGIFAKEDDLDATRIKYIRSLRSAAARWEPRGPLDPAQEKARLDRIRADEVEARLAERMGRLIPADRYEADLAGSLKLVSATLESLPDILERDAGLDGAAVDVTQKVVDGLREGLYIKLCELKA